MAAKTAKPEHPEKAVRKKVQMLKRQKLHATTHAIIEAMEEAVQKYAYNYVRQSEVPEDFDAGALDILYEQGVLEFDIQKFAHDAYKKYHGK